MSDFKILSDRDHLLLRPGMYIGSTTEEPTVMICDFEKQQMNVVPGLLKIINEIIDNSVDEAIRTNFKYANKIDVTFGKNVKNEWEITVADNGRGIPVEKHSGFYQAEAAWTQAKSGTSFSDNRVTAGMNGIGSYCTNVFSKSFIGRSCDGKQMVTVNCSDSCNPDKTTVKVTKSSINGTTITFKPDLSLFDIDDINEDHITYIHDRLVNLSICYSGIKFKFNNKPINFGSIHKVAKEFDVNAQALSFGDINIIVGPAGEESEFKFVSYINGLNVKSGGTHVDYLVGQIASELQPQIKRKWKIDVLPNQIKQHLLFGIWATGFVNPKFDSQSKEKLTNTYAEVREFFKTVDVSKIAKKIIMTDQIIEPMIEAILHKKQLADKRQAAAALRKASRKKVAKHIAAASKNPEETILHIAEGESPLAGLLEIRDSRRHGGYPLRGKILNTHSAKPSAITGNTELLELMSIIGLDLSNPSINEDPTQLFKIEIGDETFIVGKNDVIIDKSGNEIEVSKLLA